MKRQTLIGLFVFVLAVGPVSSVFAADGVIKIGISSSKSGSYTDVGASAKNGVELAAQEINAGNGLSIGNKTYALELVFVDNGSDRSTASKNALSLISQDQVMAIVGPQSSDRAILVGEVANAFTTPMVTTWATAPEVTRNRPFVFRMTVMYGIQAKAITDFAVKEWKASKAAVIYDEVSSDPSGMTKAFRQAFEKENSVVAIEGHRPSDTDFSRQLQAVINSDADFLYIPDYHKDALAIVKQARQMGWKKPIAGSNTWSLLDLATQCGTACNGVVVTGNFAAGGADGKAEDFVENYRKKYSLPPDEVAALNYDAIYLVAHALKNTGGLSGNLLTDRVRLRDQIAATQAFEGVAGTLGFLGTGDPVKCTTLIRFDNGSLNTIDTSCP
ncbi:ABC transporter substrate-binding protein [Desulfosarcina sp. OttesenSCG-928-G10]|nr:ABC transporter substrate-binding protein [Desulfosarcina sp. OttesenSCG-928-G10]